LKKYRWPRSRTIVSALTSLSVCADLLRKKLLKNFFRKWTRLFVPSRPGQEFENNNHSGGCFFHWSSHQAVESPVISHQIVNQIIKLISCVFVVLRKPSHTISAAEVVFSFLLSMVFQ